MSIEIASAEEMRQFGAKLARGLDERPFDRPVVIGLSGELGAGKTTLVAGLLASLGYSGPVRSPTYTLIEPYHVAGQDFYHCDLYRLQDPDELDDLGLRDLAVPGAVLLIEWPERAEGRLGEPDLTLRLEYLGDSRVVAATPATPAGEALAGFLLDQG